MNNRCNFEILRRQLCNIATASARRNTTGISTCCSFCTAQSNSKRCNYQGFCFNWATTANFSTTTTKWNQQGAMQQDLPFAEARVGTFLQEPPKLGNQYDDDPMLYKYFKKTFNSDVFDAVQEDAHWFGARVANDIMALGDACEQQPPYLVQYDAWGRRVDDIWTCEAWKKLKDVSAEEKLIALAYKQPYGEYSRVYQIAKLYMFAPSSGLYSCPLAMTDGAAKILWDKQTCDELKHAYTCLTSTEPSQFWTSGQWMTERKGGSDVGQGTETLALPQSDGSYTLHGYKWFTSATDSDMSITLARIADHHGNVTQGSRGLTMFYTRVRDGEGKLNHITVQRLKDKLGTRQLPTAELLLHGAEAIQLSDEGRGVAGISAMLNITRLHNSLSAVSSMRRIIQLVKDYSHRREAFGKVIKNHSLHIRTLAIMEVETRGCFLLTFEIARLLGLEETNKATEQDLLLMRVLTPLAKLYTAKQAMSVVSEGLECFGGLGYLEDSGLPRLLRDAQVLPIWEGTTNVLSLDVLRVQVKSDGAALPALVQDVMQRVNAVHDERLAPSVEKVTGAVNELIAVLSKLDNNALEHSARDLAMSLSQIYIGALMIDYASWEGADDMDVYAAIKWCSRDLVCVRSDSQLSYGGQHCDQEYQLVLGADK